MYKFVPIIALFLLLAFIFYIFRLYRKKDPESMVGG